MDDGKAHSGPKEKKRGNEKNVIRLFPPSPSPPAALRDHGMSERPLLEFIIVPLFSMAQGCIIKDSADRLVETARKSKG